MNVASLELCRELYELSGWDSTYMRWVEGASKPSSAQNVAASGFALAGEGITQLDFPAYDLGYLLRKLGEDADHYRIAVFSNDGKRWVANRTTGNTVEQQCEANNPEDAAAKIAIELFKQGVLTRETPDGR